MTSHWSPLCWPPQKPMSTLFSLITLLLQAEGHGRGRLPSQTVGFLRYMAFVVVIDCFDGKQYSNEECFCVAGQVIPVQLRHLFSQPRPSPSSHNKVHCAQRALVSFPAWTYDLTRKEWPGVKIYAPHTWLMGQSGMAPSTVSIEQAALPWYCWEMELFSNGKTKTNVSLIQVCLSSCMFFCSKPNLKPCSAKAHFSCHWGKNRLW